MSARSERLYAALNTQQDLEGLIGQPEDGDFDCKEWPKGYVSQSGTIAKAACGFTNATGGVIIIGMKASARDKDTPDMVEAVAPVADREAVASGALDIILKYVEPGIADVQYKTISHNDPGKTGFVVIHIPESEDAPRRTKTDWKFYVRITSGTIPMEYFQIEDRFGRRPHPQLVVEVLSEEERTVHPLQGPYRVVRLCIRNNGRGIARFPCLRIGHGSAFKPSVNLGDAPLWKMQHLAGWASIRGGADEVIYPGEVFPLVNVIQKGLQTTHSSMRQYDANDLEVEVICEGMSPHRQTLHFSAKTYN